MASLKEIKAAARAAAQARRKAAHAAGGDPTEALVEAIGPLPGEVVSAYWPIRTEIDPRGAMRILSATRRIVLPVVEGPGRPLSFRLWTPGAGMVPGVYGASIPAATETAEPDILILPLLAFDAEGYRLGYGGGFYDRTLERLRRLRPTVAIGLAFAAQEVPAVPREATDERLDLIVTEAGIRRSA